MALPALLECSFLIPIRRDKNLSDGGLHTTAEWAWLHEALYVFGGGTRTTDLYEGWYIDLDTGERVEDLSRKYFVAVPKKSVDQLRSILREACAVFRQKAIYLSVAGRVEFIEGARHGS